MKRYEDFINGIKKDVEVPARVQARIDATLSELPVVEETGRRKEKRSWMSTAAAAILIIIALSGCAAAGVHFSKTRVHVVVTGSQNTSNLLQGEVEYFEKRYEEEHPDIDIVVELLLDDTTDWVEADMKKMRTDIMAGKGPDLYIMKGTSFTYTEESYLFPNVNKAMQSGVFASLDKYIKKDERWENMDLIEKAMDAGTYQGKQYVIPLAIDFPLFMQEQDKAVDYSQAKTLKECVQIAKRTNDVNVIYDITFIQDNLKGLLLEPAVDYENNRILMKKEPFVDYVTYAQNEMYDIEYPEYSEEGSRIISHDASYLFNSYLFNKEERIEEDAEKLEIDFQSVPGIDGTKVGYVTSYGAVSMNSAKKDVAYDFLISFMNQKSRPEYVYEVPVNLQQLKECLQPMHLDTDAFINCCNNLDQIIFLSEGSLLTKERLEYYMSGNDPKPGPDLEEKISKIYDELYVTYETILKE